MGRIDALLSARTKKSSGLTKMGELANQSASGNLTSFSGIFNRAELNDKEKKSIEEILHRYSEKEKDENLENEDLQTDGKLEKDLYSLIAITSEVKAINNQATLLHGERIKKAHTILTNYKDGAFTAWLMAAYGNRQTPYNFLQYYEFYETLPKTLQAQVEEMPRQAIYTLASREGSLEKKQRIIQTYQGQTKAELLVCIREEFPLPEKDGRGEDFGSTAIRTLEKMIQTLKSPRSSLTEPQKTAIKGLLEELNRLLEK